MSLRNVLVAMALLGLAGWWFSPHSPRVPAPPAHAAGAGLTGLDQAVGEHLVEVAADRGRSEVEALGERGGGGGAVDEDRPGDALARRLVGRPGEFHNASVPLMKLRLQARFALVRAPCVARVTGGWAPSPV